MVSIWMREDGLILDKLVLTTDPGFTPAGSGPAESAGGSGGGAELDLYSKQVSSGSTVVLGGNVAAGAVGGGDSNYVVIVVPL